MSSSLSKNEFIMIITGSQWWLCFPCFQKGFLENCFLEEKATFCNLPPSEIAQNSIEEILDFSQIIFITAPIIGILYCMLHWKTFMTLIICQVSCQNGKQNQTLKEHQANGGPVYKYIAKIYCEKCNHTKYRNSAKETVTRGNLEKLPG